LRKIVGFALAFCSLSAFGSESNMYVGAGFGVWDYEESEVPEFSLNSAEGHIGYIVNDNLSIEGRVGLGVGDDSVTDDRVKLDLEVDNYLSVYLKPAYSSQNFGVYGLLGFTKAKLSADISYMGISDSISDSDSSFSYGLGAGFSVADGTSISLEWKQLIDADDYELSGFSVGVDFAI